MAQELPTVVFCRESEEQSLKNIFASTCPEQTENDHTRAHTRVHQVGCDSLEGES